mmetsp:Transcript_120262/g.239357  ORF Transcript_120262/g.239357 Transcript_120262/m.239357 type:complete len:201 (+) Transcript_120262:1177-1779(+)
MAAPRKLGLPSAVRAPQPHSSEILRQALLPASISLNPSSKATMRLPSSTTISRPFLEVPSAQASPEYVPVLRISSLLRMNQTRHDAEMRARSRGFAPTVAGRSRSRKTTPPSPNRSSDGFASISVSRHLPERPPAAASLPTASFDSNSAAEDPSKANTASVSHGATSILCSWCGGCHGRVLPVVAAQTLFFWHCESACFS